MATTQVRTRPSPVLQPGRPADPAPPAPVETEVKHPVEAEAKDARPPVPANSEQPEVSFDAKGGELAEEEGGHEADRAAVMMRQSGRRRLLRQCERVLLLDFNTLAMPDWPDNFTLASARRRRDLWLFSASLAAMVFLAGVPGLAPAWIAGTGFGVFVLIILAGVPVVRRLYSSQPSYMDLILRRQHRMREARSHVQHLEGSEGLAWQCAMMAEFNPALRSPRFSGLLHLSEKRTLARELRRRDHIRLFLIYMLEAEKAYERLQHSYFEGHQTAIDNGWAATEPEDRSMNAAWDVPSQDAAELQ